MILLLLYKRLTLNHPHKTVVKKHWLSKLLLLAIVSFGTGVSFAQNTLVDSLIDELPNSNGKAKVLLLSDICYYLSPEDAEKSIEYANKCLTAAKKLGDEDLIAEGFNSQGIAYYAYGDYDASLKANMNALKIRQKSGDPRGLISSYNKIANCYHDTGDYPKAIEYNLKALKLAEENDFVAYQGMLLANIGEIYKSQRKFKKAINYNQKAINLAQLTSDTIAWAKALNNGGVAYRKIGKPDSSEIMYHQALDLIEGRGLRDLEGALLLNLGVLASQNEKEKIAFGYYRRAWMLLDGSGDRHGLSVAYTNLGNTYLQMNQLDSALFFLEKSNALSKELNLKKQVLDSYKGLSRYYKVVDNYRKAYYYDSIAETVKDELLNEKNALVLEELNLKYNTEKKEKKIAEQKLLVEESNSRIRTIVFGFIIFFLLVAAASIFMVQRQKRLRRDIQLEQERAKIQIQEEKLRISRDLHDNIGAQLTLFKNKLEGIQSHNKNTMLQERLDELDNYANSTMQQLREAIWTIQSDEVTFNELIGKVASFVQKIDREKMAFSVENEVGESAPEIVLQPLQAIAIFRVIQEAINNSLKHSESPRGHVLFQEGKIIVQDYGKGFDLELAETGYGLVNMRARMEEQGYQLGLKSVPGEGTEITIHL